MLGLVIVLWPILYKWILANVKAQKVYIDEKWLKTRGKWLYWFVVLDTETGLPVLATLLPSTGKWACRWIGVKLKRIGKLPKAIITDGLPSHSHVSQGVRHFHWSSFHDKYVTSTISKVSPDGLRSDSMIGMG
jgi:transposase-like protein